MKIKNLPEHQVKRLNLELKKKLENDALLETLSKDELLTEEKVCQMLNISSRTMRKLRTNGTITCCRIGSRYYYLKTVLLLDILKLYNDT